MSEKKIRPWFQLHLSTCVVLMVVAGVLLWLNLRPPQLVRVSLAKRGIVQVFMAFDYSGWPFHRGEVVGQPIEQLGADFQVDDQAQVQKAFRELIDVATGWGPNNAGPYGDWKILFANGSFALCVIATLAFIMERRIRRRASAPKPSQ